jgi:hypothetical protein
MKNTISALIFLLISRGLLAQDILYSEKTKVNMWNGNSNSWVPILERNDTVTFILTKDRSMLLMYCRDSGPHFKYFYKENGKDMMWLAQDTTFYKIISSEVVKDINGNTGYIINTKSGVQNKDYVFHYYKSKNILHCIFDDNTGRTVENVFVIKTGSIK